MQISELFNIELPLIQAPMAGVQTSAMTIAVSNAGGLGSLPCAMLDLAQIQQELSAIASHTSKPYNVNFFCHTPPLADAQKEAQWRACLSPYFTQYGIDSERIPAGAGRRPFSLEALNILSKFKPAVVSFHFGLPADDLLAPIRAWGGKIISSATTVAEARNLAERGVDAIIAQGLEAGGHRGHFLSDDLSKQMGTFALLPQIIKAIRLPVIAAGGIADVQGVKAALQMGATGVQIGTSFMLCHEANTTAIHRAAISSCASQHTALTNLFTGRPARGIVNKLMRELGAINPAAPSFPLATAAIAPLRAHAESLGLGDFSPLWAGQNVSGCQAISAAEMVRVLAGVNNF